MSEFVQVAAEIAQLDELLDKEYKIESIIENLDGSQVILKYDNQQTKLNITTADARKYLSVKLKEQMEHNL
ncbi:hypothetical protein [uncultured Rummeliibacillus sp.]|uniref:hypothetical protein n=1 Tax=uncultured Rummeliibacillus sp. TaxID=762292 RepID=UPI002616A025|nr:hypothetical protein [uncultured Rummeliibacillus sp.]